jgi:hypothetical protein
MKLMAHPQYLAFSALYSACLARKMHAKLQIFDGGETINITDVNGRNIVRVSREYGQPQNAAAAAWQYLLENDYISSGDIEG